MKVLLHKESMNVFNDFRIGDTFHIEVVNDNGEILHRLYSTLIKVNRYNLVIDIPTSKEIFVKMALPDNSNLIISFESASKIAHRFKSTPVGATRYGDFVKLLIKRPKRNEVLSFDERKTLRVNTYFEAKIIPIEPPQEPIESIDIAYLGNAIITDAIIIDISSNGILGITLPVDVANILEVNNPLLIWTEREINIFKRDRIAEEKIAYVSTILGIRPFSKELAKVIIHLNWSPESLEYKYLQEIIYELLEQEFLLNFMRV